MSYHHILVAVDLTKDSHKILERAVAIAERNDQAKISIMHTLEPLGFAYGGDIPMDLTSIQDQLDEHAKKRLAEIAAPHIAELTNTLWWVCPTPKFTVLLKSTMWI